MKTTRLVLLKHITIQIITRRNIRYFPKTESSIGKISVDPNVIKVLRDYKINVQNNWKNELYNDNHCNEKLSMWIQTIMSRTSILKNISTHSFRYTHCALLIESGVHIKEIQERLRHKDINTTMNIYAKITNSYKKTPPISLVTKWKTSRN